MKNRAARNRLAVSSILVCLLFGTLPFLDGPVRFSVMSAELSPFIIFLFGTLLILVIVGLASSSSPRINFISIDFLIGLYGLYFISHVPFQIDLIGSARLTFFAVIVPIVCYFLVRFYIVNTRTWQLLKSVIITSGCVFAFFTIGNLVTTGSRPSVFLMPPISVATILFFSLGFVFLGQRRKKSAYLLGSFIVLGILATLSRLYILMFGLAPFIAYFVRRFARTFWLGLYLLSLFGTIYATYAYAPRDIVQIYQLGETEETAPEDRLTATDSYLQALLNRFFVYRYALRDFDRNPVFGGGLYVGDYQVTPHNLHVATLSIAGILGTLFFVLILFFHVKRMALYVSKDRDSLVLEVVLISLFLNSLTNGFFHGEIPIVFFTVLGLCESRYRMISRMQ